MVAELKCPLYRKPPLLVGFLKGIDKGPKDADAPTPIYLLGLRLVVMGLRNASETVSNASVTLQQCSTSGLHLLLCVFIHRRRFHGQWARCSGALLARVRVCGNDCVRPLTPYSPPYIRCTPIVSRNARRPRCTLQDIRLHLVLKNTPRVEELMED